MALLAFAEGIQLLPDGTIFIHIALILAMIWILNRTFFRPINKVIKSREKSDHTGLSESEAIVKQADEKNAQLEAQLLGARTKGYELIEKERNQAVSERDAAISAAKSAVEKQSARNLEILNKQTNEAREEISKEAEIMAEKISANILKAA